MGSLSNGLRMAATGSSSNRDKKPLSRAPGSNWVAGALREAIRVGIVDYVPLAMGIAITGLAACFVMAVIHFVLGVSATATVAGVGPSSALAHLVRLVKKP